MILKYLLQPNLTQPYRHYNLAGPPPDFTMDEWLTGSESSEVAIKLEPQDEEVKPDQV